MTWTLASFGSSDVAPLAARFVGALTGRLAMLSLGFCGKREGRMCQLQSKNDGG
jgi:hypothetical protein